MATEYELSYTAAEINERLARVDTLSSTISHLSSEIAKHRLTLQQVSALDELFKIAVYKDDASSSYTTFKDAFDVDGYQLYHEVDVSKFVAASGLSNLYRPSVNSEYPYVRTDGARTSYLDFDIEAQYGYTYRFEWVSTHATRLSVEFYNTMFMDCVRNNVSAYYQDSQDCGWSPSTSGAWECTPTDTTCETMRFCSDQGVDTFKSLKIYRKKMTLLDISAISATYSGYKVDVDTPLTDLKRVHVYATDSNGNTVEIMDYTLSGEIAEGENTITVSYKGKTTTFTVIGIAPATAEYTLYHEVDVSKFVVGGLTQICYYEGSVIPYINTGRTVRTSYAPFDIAAESGVTYRFDFETEAGTELINLEFYNTKYMDGVENNAAVAAADMNSPSWWTSGTEFTVPDSINEKPCEAMRMTFNSGTAVVKSVRIYRKVAS